eukprot:gene24602-32039_t
MLRLKSPAGEIPPNLYQLVDDLSRDYGQGDLRITTRQAWQIHGILKGNLKTVISNIIKIGSSTIGACGDVSRNVMCTPAPFTKPAYEYARQYSSVLAELFKPQSQALTELWLDEEKVANVEYWYQNIEKTGIDIQKEIHTAKLPQVLTSDPIEPLYGQRYLPRKFKVALTVPGDNSLDIYTNDIGLVVLTDDKTGELLGFNVMVGGGMGRTHNKESTFARIADHLGYVTKDKLLDLCKAILATQRDHGNREIRPNARMKYLVHEKGIANFKALVETYFGETIEPWKEITPWEYKDWMGWYEQGNDIEYEHRADITQILHSFGIIPIESVNPITRKSMACPALPLCGLAITEAERIMPEWNDQISNLLKKVNLPNETLITRMTGCPNGCARPYMAELGLVGDGPEMYQIWVGGSPNLTNLAFTYANKVKWDQVNDKIEKLFIQWRDERINNESFGNFCSRVGLDSLVK